MSGSGKSSDKSKGLQEMALQEKMKIVAGTFLTHRQIGEAEAVY